MKYLLIAILFCSCSQRVYTDSLQDQRKKHMQKIVQKDITKTRVFIFACIGVGFWIAANIEKNGGSN